MVRPNPLGLVVHTSPDLVADPDAARDGAGPDVAPSARALDIVTLGAAFEHEAPILLAAARAITFDDREAEDLVQTTFELAIRHVDALRDPNALRPWLLTIQTREAFRVVRRLRRELGLLSRRDVLQIQGATTMSTDHIALRDALLELPPRMRAAVVLHHMAGMTVPQVAAAVDRSENTVRSQLRLGLQRLREALRDD